MCGGVGGGVLQGRVEVGRLAGRQAGLCRWACHPHECSAACLPLPACYGLLWPACGLPTHTCAVLPACACLPACYCLSWLEKLDLMKKLLVDKATNFRPSQEQLAAGGGRGGGGAGS